MNRVPQFGLTSTQWDTISHVSTQLWIQTSKVPSKNVTLLPLHTAQNSITEKSVNILWPRTHSRHTYKNLNIVTSSYCFCATTWHGVTLAPDVNCQIHNFTNGKKCKKKYTTCDITTPTVHVSISTIRDFTMQIDAIELTAITRQSRWIFCNETNLLWTIQLCLIMIRKRTSKFAIQIANLQHDERSGLN